MSVREIRRSRFLRLAGLVWLTWCLLKAATILLRHRLNSTSNKTLLSSKTLESRFPRLVHYWTESQEEEETQVETLPNTTVQLNGFHFCPQLNGMTMNKVHLIQSPFKQLRYTPKDAVKVIEDEAMFMYYQHDHNNLYNSHPESFKRFACFMAALGNVSYTSQPISNRQLLHSLDPLYYYPRIPFQVKNETRAIKAKIAYLVLVHSINTDTQYKNIIAMLTSIMDSSSVILIHVDAHSIAMKKRIEKFAIQQQRIGQQIYVMVDSDTVIWGAGSIVLAQLKGYFELLDLADWDYVVNLSESDYAIRTTDYIYDQLEKKPGHLWIKYDTDLETNQDRIHRVVLNTKDDTWWHQFDRLRHYPWEHIFPTFKQSQWMILPRPFIQALRTDREYLNFLAWSEYAWIPDEFFFIMAAKSHHHTWSHNIFNDNKHFITPFVGNHPKWLNESMIHQVRYASRSDTAYFVRKLKAHEHPKLKRFLDQEKRLFLS